MGNSGCIVTWCHPVIISVSDTRASHSCFWSREYLSSEEDMASPSPLEVCAVVILLELASSSIQNLFPQYSFLILLGLLGPRAYVALQLLLNPGFLSCIWSYSKMVALQIIKWMSQSSVFKHCIDYLQIWKSFTKYGVWFFSFTVGSARYSNLCLTLERPAPGDGASMNIMDGIDLLHFVGFNSHPLAPVYVNKVFLILVSFCFLGLITYAYWHNDINTRHRHDIFWDIKTIKVPFNYIMMAGEEKKFLNWGHEHKYILLFLLCKCKLRFTFLID